MPVALVRWGVLLTSSDDCVGELGTRTLQRSQDTSIQT